MGTLAGEICLNSKGRAGVLRGIESFIKRIDGIGDLRGFKDPTSIVLDRVVSIPSSHVQSGSVKGSCIPIPLNELADPGFEFPELILLVKQVIKILGKEGF